VAVIGFVADLSAVQSNRSMLSLHQGPSPIDIRSEEACCCFSAARRIVLEVYNNSIISTTTFQ
jgi:hypothetical protein